MNSRRLSPFAALTGDEKQLKWLEYQSIRLPYVQGSVDPYPEDAPMEAAPAEAAPLEAGEAPSETVQPQPQTALGQAPLTARPQAQPSPTAFPPGQAPAAPEPQAQASPSLQPRARLSQAPLTAASQPRRAQPAPPAQAAPPKPPQPSAPASQPAAPSGSVTYRLDYHKPQHRQYDAVIARMKQAEQKAAPCQPLA